MGLQLGHGFRLGFSGKQIGTNQVRLTQSNGTPNCWRQILFGKALGGTALAVVLGGAYFMGGVIRPATGETWQATDPDIIAQEKVGGDADTRPDVSEQGRLQFNNGMLLSNGRLAEAYRLRVSNGSQVILEIDSEDFDTYLWVLDSDGNSVAENDDRSNFNFNSRLVEDFEAGEYYVLVSTYGVLEQGQYTVGAYGDVSLSSIAFNRVPEAADASLRTLNLDQTLADISTGVGVDSDLDEIFRSVVQVYIGGSSGSGTLLTEDGLLLTNFHVLASSDNPEVAQDAPIYIGLALEPDEPVTPLFQGSLVRSAPEEDLALVQIDRDLLGNSLPDDLVFNTIPLGDPDGVILGEEVRVLGYPGTTSIQAGGASYLTFTRGVVSAILSENGKRHDFLSDVTVNAGNSGGAALNEAGELIAVPSGTVSELGVSPSDIDVTSVLRAVSAMPEEWLTLLE